VTYRRKDPFHRRARAEGYRARSAYKLVELDRRFRLLHRGDFVVDLGAWPGGWLQVALERVGAAGRVVGVDQTALTPLGAPNVALVEGDVRQPAIAQAVLGHLGRQADVVLCDLAPKLTGIRATDDARSSELLSAMLALLPAILRRGGRCLVKVFMSSDYPALHDRLRSEFEEVQVTRPQATRRGSAELYAIGLGFLETR
jgi:23S rRNA (uridine2552-2'-O)-methyltransferase